MIKRLVITALGADRPGIVNDLSNTLTKRDLNIEDSRMSVLGGEFAILMLVSGVGEAIDKLVTDITKLESELDMKLLSRLTSPDEATETVGLYTVKIVSIDHPGIVHDITNFISQRKLNIMDLDTKRYAAAHTGAAMFSLEFTVGIPDGTMVDEIEKGLTDLCDGLNLDVSMAAKIG